MARSRETAGEDPADAGTAPDAGVLQAALLGWYDRHARTLPWRSPPGGARPDPYHVWLSEIMLQQTTVAAVAPYFHAFLERWPQVRALAAAPQAEVLAAWAGLGYYARARNLHRCAQTVAQQHGGRFPDTEAGLRALPGIGAYTAGAIAAIAFDRPAAAVDGNVERVMARLRGIATPLPAARPALRRLAEALVPKARPGDFAQALMDLGATVCTPRRPQCLVCPWSGACRARHDGNAAALPAKVPKAARPHRHGISFWAMRGDGAVLLRRRPERGMLGGMLELPGTEWRAGAWTAAEAEAGLPVRGGWRLLPGRVEHGFTHFSLSLGVLAARLTASEAETAAAHWAGSWWPADRLAEAGLPTLMRKVAEHALKTG